MDTKAAFEKWWESFHETKPWTAWDSLYVAEHDYYADEEIDGQYDSWKASRSAIEIELPDGDMHMTYSGHQKLMLPNLGVRNAITSHGIRIKGKTE